MTACLSLYTLIPLSYLVSIDELVGVGMLKSSYLKKDEVWGRNVAEFNMDLVSIRKQLL